MTSNLPTYQGVPFYIYREQIKLPSNIFLLQNLLKQRLEL